MAETSEATTPVQPVREPITDIDSARHELYEVLQLPDGTLLSSQHIDLTGEDRVRYSGLDLERVMGKTSKGDEVMAFAAVFKGAGEYNESRALFIHPVDGYLSVAGPYMKIQQLLKAFRKDPNSEQFQLSKRAEITEVKKQDATSQATFRLLDRALMHAGK